MKAVSFVEMIRNGDAQMKRLASLFLVMLEALTLEE